jgi:hypothetical protein
MYRLLHSPRTESFHAVPDMLFVRKSHLLSLHRQIIICRSWRYFRCCRFLQIYRSYLLTWFQNSCYWLHFRLTQIWIQRSQPYCYRNTKKLGKGLLFTFLRGKYYGFIFVKHTFPIHRPNKCTPIVLENCNYLTSFILTVSQIIVILLASKTNINCFGGRMYVSSIFTKGFFVIFLGPNRPFWQPFIMKKDIVCFYFLLKLPNT